MTYPPAEEPDRPDTTGPPAVTEPPADVEPGPASPSDAGAAVLSEKPVLEWTTEDWARWIEEPSLLSRPPPEADAGGDAPEAGPGQEPTVPEEMGIDDDPTSTWSLALEEDENARWWSTVAGLPDEPAAAPAPSPPPPVPVITPPPVLPPPLPLRPETAAPPAPAPPTAAPRPSEPVAAPRRPQHPLTAPGAAEPSRSPQARGVPLDPMEDPGVRVRAGLSLLGVSVLVGAVAAGLITVAIFMASVVLRRALG